MISRIYDQLQSIAPIFYKLEDSDKAGMVWFQPRNDIIVPYKCSLSQLSNFLASTRSIFGMLAPSLDILPSLSPKSNLINLSLLHPVPINFYFDLFNTIPEQSYMDISLVNDLIYFVPQWDVYFAYDDNVFQEFWDGLTGYRKKIDEDVFEWRESPYFLVNKVIKDKQVYYSGLVKSRGISPDSFISIIDKASSTIEVTKLDDSHVTMTAPKAPKWNPDQINSIINQDDNMTSNVLDKLIQFKPNYGVPDSYTDAEISKEQELIYNQFQTLSSRLTYIQAEIDAIRTGNDLVAQKRYDSLKVDDDKVIYHGNLTPDLYNTLASTYNWSLSPSTSYSLLPAPTTTVVKEFETLIVPIDKSGKIWTIGRTYNYLQIGKTEGGMSPEPQGLIIQAQDVLFPNGYATIRLIVRQNKLYGTYNVMDGGVPALYREKHDGSSWYVYRVGAVVKIQIGTKQYPLFGMKDYIRRDITSTLTPHCMYSDQIPVAHIKIKNDNWYLAFPEEPDLSNILFIYDRITFTEKITDFNDKILFFSTFGAFQAFVNALMNGSIKRDGDSLFRVRFNIADYDSVNDLPSSTCFDFELKDWDFNSNQYIGSVFVSPDLYMVMEVMCQYTAGKLKWKGNDFVLTDAQYEIKKACLYRDIWAGGFLGGNYYRPLFNFVQNCHSDLLIKFNSIDSNADGYNNKYLLGIFKLLMDENTYDIRINVGDIDLNGYYDDPDNWNGGTLARVCHVSDLGGTLITCDAMDYIDSAEVIINFAGYADYSKVPNMLRTWGLWNVKVPTKFGDPSPTTRDSTIDKIRINFTDLTNNQTTNILKFTIISGESLVALARMEIPVTALRPPYRVVLDWDSSAPDILKLVDFFYERKFN